MSSRTLPRRRAVPIAAMAAIAAGGMGGPVAAEATAPGATKPAAMTCSTKAVQPSIAGDRNSLNGVAVRTGCNALAVGFDGATPLALHWNGRSWRRVATPKPAGVVFSELDQVAFDSPSTAWAVGLSSLGNGDSLTLIMRWNGRSWRQVKSPSPGGAFGDSSLGSVVTTSSASALAVGSQRNASQFSQPLAEIWNGHVWARIDVPFSFGGGVDAELTGVAAAPHGTAWVVGTFGTNLGGPQGSLIYSYSDGHFTQTTITRPTGVCLFGVASASATRAWAVGSICSPQTSKPVILEWNGTRWNRQFVAGLPAGASGSLADLTVASPSSAWAAGDLVTKGGVIKNLIAHWNGTTWRVIPSANPGGTGKPDVADIVNGIAGRSCATIWAVGDYVKNESAQHSTAVRC